MYGQILTNKDGSTVKILGVSDEIIFISTLNDHTIAHHASTKQGLIALGWIFPVEKWVPERGMAYFIPDLFAENKYTVSSWFDRKFDNHWLANNLVCRTKEEAIALTDKMLTAVKN